jgi:hypothetical protein
MKKILTVLALAFYLNIDAQIITTIAGNGTGSYNGDGTQATNADISSPKGIACDISGNIYIADYSNQRIRVVSTSGIINTIAGNGTAGYSGDGGQATNAEIHNPEGVAVDAAGNVYIADIANNRIRIVNTAGIINTFAGNGTAGYSGDGAAATAAKLNGPQGVAVDALGNLYIADQYNNVIRKVNTSGIISTVAGNVTQGYNGDGGAATAAEINQPYGVVCDALGNMYIADQGNSCIRKVNTAGIISTVAGNGTQGYGGDNGAATVAALYYPRGITVDTAGNLYIADLNNNVIRKVDTSGIITTIVGNGFDAGTGNGGFSGDGGNATAAELNGPRGIVCDVFGNLFITDTYNNRLRIVTSATSGVEQFVSNNEQASIYPNPANQSFVIETNTNQKQFVQVVDVTGKIVLSQNINNTTTINASCLSQGVYNISISNSQNVTNKKLIIVR